MGQNWDIHCAKDIFRCLGTSVHPFEKPFGEVLDFHGLFCDPAGDSFTRPLHLQRESYPHENLVNLPRGLGQ